ncbi:MAG: thiamine diphosphokinase [Anaerolineae bacterium]|nr:thiamine diphosphokinase [Anaerolineae bacterium]
MRAVIVANGDLQTNPRLQRIWQEAELRIAADGGARHARLQLERAPHVVIGDMDSLDGETRAWLEANNVEMLQYPRAKDETDLELAILLARERGATETLILGASGGRADQWLANVMLLTRSPNVKLTDATTEMWMGTGNEQIEGHAGDVISLIPLDPTVTGITTTGLEYPLRGETLERGSTRGISNVMLGERAGVRWNAGTLLLVHLIS